VPVGGAGGLARREALASLAKNVEATAVFAVFLHFLWQPRQMRFSTV
jgi:hypothetical protein